jgi:hypothetical protein
LIIFITTAINYKSITAIQFINFWTNMTKTMEQKWYIWLFVMILCQHLHFSLTCYFVNQFRNESDQSYLSLWYMTFSYIRKRSFLKKLEIWKMFVWNCNSCLK